MSDLSPECAAKRTSVDHSEFVGSRPGERVLLWETIHGWGNMLHETNPNFHGYVTREKPVPPTKAPAWLPTQPEDKISN